MVGLSVQWKWNLVVCIVVAFVFAGLVMTRPCLAKSAKKKLTAEQARICVTGYDHNRPDPFPGLGDFIGWAKAIERMPNGDILVAHSAGYWHASFASPRQFEPALKKKYAAEGWPVDFPAPTGGRSMACRSSDGGKTWSKPATVMDYRLADAPTTLFTCRDGTVLCFINVQASWYGYPKAPKAFENDINGMNTKQCVVRSRDNGRTWSEPIWLNGPGTFYERPGGRPIQLADGRILWATYCNSSDTGEKHLFGAIHRSDDSGKTWKVISVFRRKGKPVDEPAIAQLKDGRLIMVTRPDGGVLYSKDQGVTWEDSGRTVVKSGKFKAPQLFVLGDGTVVTVATWSNLRVWLSRDQGKTWSKAIPLDTSCYGYPGGVMLDDESILVSYCQSGKAPNRVYVIRFRVNKSRTGIELVPIGEPSASQVRTKGKSFRDRGWTSPWLFAGDRTEKTKYIRAQRDVVFEGDMALEMSMGTVIDRHFPPVSSGVLKIEMYVRPDTVTVDIKHPKACVIKVYASDADKAGGWAFRWHYPFAWPEVGGNTYPRFYVIDGKGKKRKGLEHTDFRIEAGKWYKVAAVLHFATKTWEFWVNDTKYDYPKLFGREMSWWQRPGKLSNLRITNAGYGKDWIDSIKIYHNGKLIASTGFDSDEGYEPGKSIIPPPAAVRQ